jgi:hypothetical protein
VVANMVTAPHHDIVADFYKWLDGVVFKDETIIAAGEVRPRCCFGAYVTYK